MDKGDIIAFAQNISRDWYRLFVSLEEAHREDVRKLGEEHAKDLEEYSAKLKKNLVNVLNDTARPLGESLSALLKDSEALENLQVKFSKDLVHSETELKKFKDSNEKTQKKLNKFIEMWNKFVPQWNERKSN
jgi:thymidine phosphorylase